VALRFSAVWLASAVPLAERGNPAGNQPTGNGGFSGNATRPEATGSGTRWERPLLRGAAAKIVVGWERHQRPVGGTGASASNCAGGTVRGPAGLFRTLDAGAGPDRPPGIARQAWIFCPIFPKRYRRMPRQSGHTDSNGPPCTSSADAVAGYQTPMARPRRHTSAVAAAPPEDGHPAVQPSLRLHYHGPHRNTSTSNAVNAAPSAPRFSSPT